MFVCDCVFVALPIGSNEFMRKHKIQRESFACKHQNQNATMDIGFFLVVTERSE